MGSKPKAPEPPDPQETASAQTAQNVSTAVANAFLGNVNQQTPQGSLTYEPTSTYQWTDYSDPENPKTYDIPRFTATQELSPEQRRLYEIGAQTEENIANIGQEQSTRIRELLSDPVNLEGLPERYGADGFSEDRLRVEQALMGRMEPYLERQREQTRSDLANQGFMLGSEGYERGMDDYSRAVNDARLGVIGAAGQEQSRLANLANAARSSALQERFAQRNQPINEITALMTGSQVSQPNFVPTGMPQIPTTDIAGITNQNYNQRLAAHRLNSQRSGLGPAVLGGLFSLGGGALSGGYI